MSEQRGTLNAGREAGLDAALDSRLIIRLRGG